MIAFMAANRLPAIDSGREFAEAGGLIGYSTNYDDLLRQAAGYVDRILKGETPGELPVQQAATFELLINLTAAKALGLTVPPPILARADDVEAFGEPVVDRREQIAGFGAAAPVAAQSDEARGGAQFPEFGRAPRFARRSAMQHPAGSGPPQFAPRSHMPRPVGRNNAVRTAPRHSRDTRWNRFAVERFPPSHHHF